MLVSILDNDFYKFTMQNAVVKLFPNARTRYQFINRGQHHFPLGFAERLRHAVNGMSRLALTTDERRFLERTCPYLDPSYHDFLQGFRFDPAEVKIVQHGKELDIVIEGLWYRTILWEVPLMALISEQWFQMEGQDRDSDDVSLTRTRKKIDHYRNIGIKVADFGTRRRYSYDFHDKVISTLTAYGQETFTGTSNVYLAYRHGIKPLGTHAHEWFMFHAAKYGFKMANSMALNNWVRVYRGDLGIALTDTFTTDVFFKNFDKMLAKLFDGLRHDSGDPIVFAKKAIEHYERMGIDPRTKTIVFSDALDPEKVDRIVAYCRNKIGMSFGIGTNFTNDVGLKSMNMVVKMMDTRPELNDQWLPVVKLSDIKEKNTGAPEMIRLARQVLSLPE